VQSLPLLVLLPLLGALLVGLTPRDAVRAQRTIALLATLATCALGLWICVDFDGRSAAFQQVFDVAWFTLPGSSGGVPVHVRLGLDGLSVLMVGLTALLGPIVVLSTEGHIESRVKEFMVWLLVMQAGMLGVFLALDVILFYVFWETSLVPLYFIVGIWGGERRLYATIKFFLYTVAGSLVMMIAVIALVWRLDTTDIGRLTEMASNLPLSVQRWRFAASGSASRCSPRPRSSPARG
jgi:NADH-quinone oxidoreductase subunit M